MKGDLLPKVKALYEAVLELIGENVDIRDVKVSDITKRAGIGKGTAYEYFSNKEEIISSALLYHIDMICGQMMESVGKIEKFHDKIDYMFLCMDMEIAKRDCLIQFIQLMIDNGPVSRLLQKKIKENDSGIRMPQDVLEQVLRAGIRQGEIKAQLPMFYMNMVVMSKILAYAIYLTSGKAEGKPDGQKMHQLLYEGLLKELG